MLTDTSFSLMPAARLSRMALSASIAFALLSACGGWVFSGANFRSVTSPWKMTAFKEECRAAPPWDADLTEMRQAVETFEAREYAPPVWARNAHLHTIVASGDMEKKLLGDRVPLGYWRERWPTPDGDFVDIDWLPAEKAVEDDPKPPQVPPPAAGVGAGASALGAEEPLTMHVGGGIHGQPEASSPKPRGMVTAAEVAAAAAAAAVEDEEENIEELREMAVLAKRAHDNNLGIGHPAAPEPVHEDDPSWMSERSKGEGGQGKGGVRRLVLVLHGLESSSTAPLTKRFSSVYTRNGFDVAALNFRGCSGELSRNPVGYHLGFTDDLLHVIEEIHRRFPGTWDRIYLTGFSLGGNVIVKFLGEQGDRARALGIYGAAVGCVPFEPKIAAEKLEKDPVGRYVYMPVFMSGFKIKAAAHAKAHPDKLSMETVEGVKTFTEFNSKITSPLFDFSSAEEFYEEVNAANYLSRVRVPLVVVNAKDDPFIDGNLLPEQDRVEDAPVRLVYHDYGGHCGFMSGVVKGKTLKRSRKWGAPWKKNWVPWGSRGDPEALLSPEGDENAAPDGVDATAAAVVAEADTSLMSDGTPADVGESAAAAGGGMALKEGRWLPTELARFVTHLEESLHKDGRSALPGSRAGAAADADSCAVRVA